MKFETVSKIDKFKVLLIALMAIIFLQKPAAAYAGDSQPEQAPWQEIWTLNEVETTLETTFIKVGQTDKALEVFAQALQIANTITDVRTRTEILSSIAGSFAEAGQYKQALQTAQSITDAWRKAFALSSVAESLANAGQTDKALDIFAQTLQTVQSITDAKTKVKVLHNTAEKLAKAGQTDKALDIFAQALQTAQSITDARQKAEVLGDIAKSFANVGQYEDALRIAYRISLQHVKKRALRSIDNSLYSRAKRLAKAGQHEQALQITNFISEANRSYALKDLCNVLQFRAESLANAGQTDKALDKFAQALQTAQSITDAKTKAKVLGDIAKSFAEVGQMSIKLSVDVEASKPLDVNVSEPLDMRVSEPLEEDKLYGIYARGDCQSQAYILYFLKDVQLFISKDYAEIQHSISVRKTRSSLIQQRKVKENSYEVMYFQLDKSVLKLFAAGRFDIEQNLDNFPDNPPHGLLPVEFNKCKDIPSELSFIHADGIKFMKSLDDISIKCEKEKDKCIEYIFSMVDISKDNKLSKAELSRIFRIITYIAVVSGKEGEAKTEDITGISAIVSIISPSVAGAIIAGSDYDNDGQLSLEEMFFDRDISSVARTFEKFSFDVAVSFFIKAFGALSSILKFIP